MRSPLIEGSDETVIMEQELPVAIAQELGVALSHVPQVPLDPFHYDDVICLAQGVYSPLRGFLNRYEVRTVLSDMRLPDGQLWPIPITLPIDPSVAQHIKKAGLVRLMYGGNTVALMHVEDLYWQSPEDEARIVYGTSDTQHPGVRRMLDQSPMRIAGPVTLTRDPKWSETPILTPRQMRSYFREHGWRTVVAFQTRNPLHRAHEYIQKTALEMVDGLVIHPLIGETKQDDVPASIRWASYLALVREYYPEQNTLLSGFPAAMRYAGPKEAVLHALARKNYGFTHFIVGRDHAGVGSYYHPLASQKLLSEISSLDLGITIINAEPAFFCRRCHQMATQKTCPHGTIHHESLSGTRVRKALQEGTELRPDTIRPEVEEILRQYYQNH